MLILNIYFQLRKYGVSNLLVLFLLSFFAILVSEIEVTAPCTCTSALILEIIANGIIEYYGNSISEKSIFLIT